MNADSKKSFSEYSLNEMRTNGDKIKQWAQQSDNLLLKQCAIDVLRAAGATQ